MLSFIEWFNRAMFLVFTAFYIYQFFFVFVSLFKKAQKYEASKIHKYAVVIAARNESCVIGELIASIKKQKYPESMLDIYVVADNCEDNTAEVAEKAGAIVFERENTTQVGKGYALDHAFKQIIQSDEYGEYDGFFVFDADNLLDENFVKEMNAVFDQGYRVVTSYRNSKNYDSNWISAGYALWFLRESRFLNNSRMLLGTSSAISGTGFLVSSEIIKENGGWKHHCLTEDIEFTADNVIRGEIIGYCGAAKVYDEQPVTFRQSWLQRLRWSKGFYQVFSHYGTCLLKGMWKLKSFSCFDIFMTISPAMIITFGTLIVNASFLVMAFFPVYRPHLFAVTISTLGNCVLNFYTAFFFCGLMTIITEWKSIRAVAWKKLVYLLMFPIFMITYVPISLVALFKKVEWYPIKHGCVKSIEEL